MKNLLNMIVLLAMGGLMIADVKLYPLWALILASVVVALNYKALIVTVNKLLKKA